MTSTADNNNKPNPLPPPLSNETLRERILTGGGTGAARGSLTKVASRYAEFIHALSSNNTVTADGDDDEASSTVVANAASSLQTELLLHDLEIRKLILSSRASDGNTARYNSTLSQMQQTLSSTQADIETLTSTLTTERQIKHRREEYNALAKIGNNSHPPIRVTQNELEKVQKDIESVKNEVKGAQWELGIRERQMRVFMASLGDLKSTLKEEEVRKEIGEAATVKGNTTNEGGEEQKQQRQSSSSTNKKRKRLSEGGEGSDSNDNDDIGAL